LNIEQAGLNDDVGQGLTILEVVKKHDDYTKHHKSLIDVPCLSGKAGLFLNQKNLTLKTDYN
jgi:hypothetical protein